MRAGRQNPLAGDYSRPERIVDNPGGLDGAYGYKLESGSSYALDLVFYRPDEPPELVAASKLLPTVQESLFAFSPSPIETNFGYDKRSIVLFTQPVHQTAFTRLSLELQAAPNTPKPLQVELVKLPAALLAGGQQPQAQPVSPVPPPIDPPVRAPQPTLLLRLKPPVTVFLGFIGLVVAQVLVAVGSNIDTFASPSATLTQDQIYAKQIGLSPLRVSHLSLLILLHAVRCIDEH